MGSVGASRGAKGGREGWRPFPSRDTGGDRVEDDVEQLVGVPGAVKERRPEIPGDASPWICDRIALGEHQGIDVVADYRVQRNPTNGLANDGPPPPKTASGPASVSMPK
jgi:hypothetical protein